MLTRALQIAVVGMLLFGAAGGGWLVGGGPLRGHAEAPATVDAETAQELGFGEPEVEEIQVQETIQAQGIEKRLNVSAYVMATGTKNGNAQVAVMSLPGWTIAGVTTNPLAYVPLKQAVKHILPNLPADTPDVAWEGQSTVELGEKEVTAGEYTVEGEPIRIIVARASMENDLVFAVGIYSPESEDARDRIERLFGNLSH